MLQRVRQRRGARSLTLRRLLTRWQPPEEGAEASPLDFLYEPEPEKVLDDLLPRYVEAQFYQAVLESIASEQARA